MAKTTQQLQFQMRISSINVLKFSQFDIGNFNIEKDGLAEYETDFTLKVFEESNELGVEAATRIKIIETNEAFGELKVLIKFLINPFDLVVIKDGDQTFNIPDPLLHNLFNVTAGTIRGVLYEKLRGTALQNEAFPLLDLNSLLTIKK